MRPFARGLGQQPAERRPRARVQSTAERMGLWGARDPPPPKKTPKPPNHHHHPTRTQERVFDVPTILLARRVTGEVRARRHVPGRWPLAAAAPHPQTLHTHTHHHHHHHHAAPTPPKK